jgi:hypothetical protein
MFEVPINPEKKSPKKGEETKSLSQNREKSGDNKMMIGEGISRRRFLGYMAGSVAAVAGCAAKNVVAQSGVSLESLQKSCESLEIALAPKDKIEVYRKEDDLKTVDKILNFKDKNPIIINRKTAEDTKEHWKKEYHGNSHLSDSLASAYGEIQEKWVTKLSEKFKEHGVPEKYLYLAIPESHWKWKDDSPAGARGPYQFMAETARKFGLRVDDKVDERLDPEKSAEACAKYLKDLYDKTHDWDLALSGYNGGFIWDYLTDCKNDDGIPNYDGFLKFIETRANRYKREYQTGFTTHKVKEGDSLPRLAEKFGVSVSSLKRHNNILGDKLAIGSIVKAFVKNGKKREAILQRRKSGISENLNYPPKFNAVMEIIDEKIRG